MYTNDKPVKRASEEGTTTKKKKTRSSEETFSLPPPRCYVKQCNIVYSKNSGVASVHIIIIIMYYYYVLWNEINIIYRRKYEGQRNKNESRPNL